MPFLRWLKFDQGVQQTRKLEPLKWLKFDRGVQQTRKLEPVQKSDNRLLYFMQIFEF